VTDILSPYLNPVRIGTGSGVIVDSFSTLVVINEMLSCLDRY